MSVAMELQDGTHLGRSGCGQFAHVCVAGLLHCLRVVVGGGTPWGDHVDDVIAHRREVCRHLLPEGFFLESGVLNLVGVGQGSAEEGEGTGTSSIPARSDSWGQHVRMEGECEEGEVDGVYLR